MQRNLLALAAAAAMAAAPALSIQAAVEILPLPDGVKSVSPAQGRIDIGKNASPLGARVIGLVLSDDARVNSACTATAHIYKDGDEQPFASATVADAWVDQMNYSVVSIMFNRSCNMPGTYHVVLPAGLWISGSTPTPEVELNYEIIVPQTISPLQGTVESLSEFQLSFPGYDAVEYDSSKKLDFYKVGSDESFKVTAMKVDATTIALILNKEVTEPGTYSLMIPANTFKASVMGDDGSVVETVGNTEVIYTWTISTIPAPGIEPAPGVVESFKTFTLTAPEGFQVFMVDDRTRNNIYPVEADGNLSPDPICFAIAQRTEEGNILLNITDPETGMPVEEPFIPAPGKYCLQLARMLMSGMWNDAFESTSSYNYYYEVKLASGVNIVPTEEGKFEVYTITGQHAATLTDRAALSTLPKGLYIINGSKYLRR